MNSQPSTLVNVIEHKLHEAIEPPPAERIIEFYEEASLDYGHWSPGFNMHLGFYRRGLNPLIREQMLEQMNIEVARRLELNLRDRSFLIDFGCGLGAVSRTIAGKFPNVMIKGVTISPAQVETASALNRGAGLEKQIDIFKGDYTKLPVADGAADGVWAVESACHAQGADKIELIREMARVLRPGGRFVIADCFIKRPDTELNFLIKRCYRAACKYWALSEMPRLASFAAALEKYGFQNIMVEDISWRIAPSVVQAPAAVVSFIIKKLRAGESLNESSINNLKASLLAPVLGLNRSKFSYCLISGQRKGFLRE